MALQNQFLSFILKYLPSFFNTHPTTPQQVPVLAIDILQPSTPHPPLDNHLNHCPAPNNTIAPKSSLAIQFHPITLLIRELELGKSILNFGVPITIAVLISHDQNFHTTFSYFMVSGLSIGSMAIWNGITLRETFARTANVIEQLGILMVLLSFTGLLALALPPEFMWVSVLSSALSFLPFLFQAFSYCTTNQIQTVAT